MKRFLVLLVYLITLNSDLFASHPTFINIITNSDTIYYPTLTGFFETGIPLETGKFDPSLPLAFKAARLFDMLIEDIFHDKVDS